MRITFIGPGEEQCGIAEYTRNLKKELELLGIEVGWIRYSHQHQEVSLSELPFNDNSIVHIQYTNGLFGDNRELRQFLMNRQSPTVITAHHQDSFIESIEDYVNQIIVHKESCAVSNKYSYLVQGCSVNETSPTKTTLRKEFNIHPHMKVIASYGFIIRWKQLDYMFRSFAKYLELDRDLFMILLHSYHAFDLTYGKKIAAQFKSIVAKHPAIQRRIIINHSFLDKKEVLKYLRVADIGILFSPDEMNTEGSSAALKDFIAARCPVVVSNISHYRDIAGGIVHTTPGEIKQLIYKTLSLLYNDEELTQLSCQQELNYQTFNFTKFAIQHLHLYLKVLGE